MLAFAKHGERSEAKRQEVRAVRPLAKVTCSHMHPSGWGSSPQVAGSLLEYLKNAPKFHLTYQRDDVYSFSEKA